MTDVVTKPVEVKMETKAGKKVSVKATQTVEKNKGGRPAKYTDPLVLVAKATEYFELCDKNRQLPEKAGLCLALGISKDTYCEYRKQKRFSDAIKGLDMYIESCWVRRLNGQAPAGAIFYLKNAFKEDFKDKQEVEHSGQLGIAQILDEAEKS